MTPELEAHVAERQREIALLRDLYRFSAQEAEDFILQFKDKPQADPRAEETPN